MINVRVMREEDAERAAQVLVAAFAQVYHQRGHVPPFPNLESAIWLCRAYLDLDPDGCAVAEVGGALVGVGFVHPRGGVASIGPLAARPGGPRGVGQALMAHLTRLTAGCASVRLFQDSFNPDSFGLYAQLGYTVRDVAPYLLAAELKPAPGRIPHVRPFVPEDMPALRELDQRLVGADRTPDLALLISTGSVLVCERGRGLEGFLFLRALPARAIVGPAVAISEELLCLLVDAATQLLPGRSAVMRASAASPAVLGRAFARGFRVDHLGNLMASGTMVLPPTQLYALFPESL
ncbi:MAG: GNAT family N-acetyltransferase [Bacteroidota bacterium]